MDTEREKLHIEFHILLDWQRSTRALFMFCSLEGEEGGNETGERTETEMFEREKRFEH